MVALTMLETRKGTEDGFTVKQYYRGESYEIADGLARSFLAAGFAVMKDSNISKRDEIILWEDIINSKL